MGDTWGDEGPPEEAYSRVTRDLPALTAEFAAYLDGLPDALATEFDCRVRPPTTDELTALDPDRRGHDALAVEAADPTCAVLLISRTAYQGGATAMVAFGHAVHEPIPSCLCDACDEDSGSMVEQVRTLVAAVVGGAHEYRRPYEPFDDDGDLYDPPWLEHGIECEALTTSHAGHNLTGEEFSVQWSAWPRRGPDSQEPR